MKSDLSLFDADESPVTWRRQGEGTFFFIQSRVPDCYEVRCVDAGGHRANPGEGTAFEAWFLSESEGIKKSAPYSTVGLAKAACDHHHLHGTFPP